MDEHYRYYDRSYTNNIRRDRKKCFWCGCSDNGNHSWIEYYDYSRTIRYYLCYECRKDIVL